MSKNISSTVVIKNLLKFKPSPFEVLIEDLKKDLVSVTNFYNLNLTSISAEQQFDIIEEIRRLKNGINWRESIQIEIERAIESNDKQTEISANYYPIELTVEIARELAECGYSSKFDFATLTIYFK